MLLYNLMIVKNSDSVTLTTPTKESLYTDAISAADNAYVIIAEQIQLSPNKVNNIPSCFRVASYMVSSLIDNGHRAQQEFRGGWNIIAHSYVTVKTANRAEIVIDPTWQQFLPENKRMAEVPKVLFGSRAKVVSKARSFGVDEFALQLLWKKPLVKIVVRNPRNVSPKAK